MAYAPFDGVELVLVEVVEPGRIDRDFVRGHSVIVGDVAQSFLAATEGEAVPVGVDARRNAAAADAASQCILDHAGSAVDELLVPPAAVLFIERNDLAGFIGECRGPSMGEEHECEEVGCLCGGLVFSSEGVDRGLQERLLGRRGSPPRETACRRQVRAPAFDGVAWGLR